VRLIKATPQNNGALGYFLSAPARWIFVFDVRSADFISYHFAIPEYIFNFNQLLGTTANCAGDTKVSLLICWFGLTVTTQGLAERLIGQITMSFARVESFGLAKWLLGADKPQYIIATSRAYNLFRLTILLSSS
jgi:hypothetical protein